MILIYRESLVLHPKYLGESRHILDKCKRHKTFIRSPFGRLRDISVRVAGGGDDGHIVEVGRDAARTLAAPEELVGLAALGREEKAARIKGIIPQLIVQ